MKKKAMILVVCYILISLTQLFAHAQEEQMRGIWVSTVYNLDYPKSPTVDAESLKKEADEIIENVANTGLNAIFLQVRPSADSFYESDIFPWSKYLTGSVAKAPSDEFDPLEYFIEEAHKKGIELHAWINPYRITKDGESEYNALPESHPAKTNPEYVVIHEGNYYFNPGMEEVRELIIDSVLEIAENYDIDGVHMDDYFYPGSDFNDAHTYEASNGQSIEEFRRDSVTELVSQLNTELSKIDNEISFGISPFGIWANKSSNLEGSNTNGGESLNQHYADTKKWVEDEIIDYIAPQLYWHIGSTSADYLTLINWWSDVVSGTSVKLYIGQAIYRSYEAESDSVWYGTDEIERQLEINANTKEVDGSIFFRYEHLLTVAGMAEIMSNSFDFVKEDKSLPDIEEEMQEVIEEAGIPTAAIIAIPATVVGSVILLKSILKGTK